MELESKIAQLYKTISQRRTLEERIYSRANSAISPLYFLERVANYLVRNNLVENYFEQSDFDKLQLDRDILLEIGNSIDSEIEQLSDFKLRQFCKKFINLYLDNRPINFGLTKRKSNDYYNFIVDIVKPSPNQIIYEPDCYIGLLFIKLNREFPDYNLKFIGQASSSKNHSFICKVNLFANGLEKVSSIYSEDSLDVSKNQTKAKSDIAIATNYLHQLIYPRKKYDISQLESYEKIHTTEVAYIELMLSMTKDNGKVIAVVPDNFLVNNQDEFFRKKYLENDLVEKITSLPTTSIIVLNKEKSSQNKGFVIFDGKDDDRFEETKVSIDEILSTDNCDLQVVRYASKERKKEIEEHKNDIKEVELILTNSQYPVKKVKDLVEFSTSGHYYSPSDEVIENSLEILPYVRVSDLAQNRNEFDLDISKVERKISREKALPKTIVDFSAVLVLTFALNLRRTYFNFTGQPIVIDSDVIALKLKENVNVEHFLLQLHSRLVQLQVKVIGSGKNNNRISKENLLSIKIILPPLEEQNRQTIEFLKEEQKELVENFAEVKKEVKTTEYDVIAAITHNLNQKLGQIVDDYGTLMLFLQNKEKNRMPIRFDEMLRPVRNGESVDNIPTFSKVANRLQNNLLDTAYTMKTTENILQKSVINTEELDIITFFKTSIKADFENPHFTIKIESKLKSLIVLADINALKDAFRNLIENAKKHGFTQDDQKYQIVFEISEFTDNLGENFARIVYKNNGSPFPKSYRFEDYTRLGTRMGKNKGTGIGGFFVKKVIDLHKGSFKEITLHENNQETFQIQMEILLPLAD